MLKLAVLLAVVALVACSPMTGGFQEETNFELGRELALWSTQHPSLKGELNAATLAEVLSVQKQLVNGMNYRVTYNVIIQNEDKYECKTCEIVVYVSFSNERTLSTANCIDNPKYFGKLPYIGGQQEETDSAVLQSLATFAINTHQQSAKSQFGAVKSVGLLSVQEATKQVVAGIVYKFKMTVLAQFEDSQSTSKQCDCEVWERLWLSESQQRELISISCKDSYEVMVGGPMPVTDSLVINELANFIVAQQSTKDLLGATQTLTFLSAPSVTKQLVNGFLYKFVDMKVLNQHKLNEYKFQLCEVTVLEKAWETPSRKVLTISCVDTN